MVFELVSASTLYVVLQVRSEERVDQIIMGTSLKVCAALAGYHHDRCEREDLQQRLKAVAPAFIECFRSKVQGYEGLQVIGHIRLDATTVICVAIRPAKTSLVFFSPSRASIVRGTVLDKNATGDAVSAYFTVSEGPLLLVLVLAVLSRHGPLTDVHLIIYSSLQAKDCGRWGSLEPLLEKIVNKDPATFIIHTIEATIKASLALPKPHHGRLSRGGDGKYWRPVVEPMFIGASIPTLEYMVTAVERTVNNGALEFNWDLWCEVVKCRIGLSAVFLKNDGIGITVQLPGHPCVTLV